MAKVRVEIGGTDAVEHGHVTVQCPGGTIQGWWLAVRGKGRGYHTVDPGTTGMGDAELRAKLDAGLEEYWQGV